MWSRVTNTIYLTGYQVLFIFNCYLYWKILTTLRRRKHNKELQISANFERNIQQITIMVIINGMVYFLYYTIFQVNMIIGTIASFDIADFYEWVRFGFIRDIAMVLNASSNPVIYFITNSRYRQAYKTSIMKCFGIICKKSGKEAIAFRR